MLWSLFHRKSPSGRRQTGPLPNRRCRPTLECLEDRVVPYALSGYQWANTTVSVSYLPDGTWTQGYQSNLFALYNASYPTATWQYQFAKALQTWADVSPLNFHFVSDDGSPGGTSGLAQGDPRFGDIRLGSTLGQSMLGFTWYPSNSGTIGGDITLNGYAADPMGSVPDLAFVVLHEAGHAIGLAHSLDLSAVMAAAETGVYSGLTADDIAGVQAIYGARKPDVYDAKASNDTLATATALTLSSGAITTTADITTMSDVDYYRLTVPSGSDGTLTVSVDARNLSLFDPNVTVYDSSGTQLATASASTYGDVATVKLTGLLAGQTYYLRASGATTDVFGMGAYQLSVQFGGLTAPAGPGPDRFETNNIMATATNFGTLTSLSQTALTLHTSSDVDDYLFTAGSKGTFTVSTTPSQGSGTLSLTVLDAQQTVLASGQSQTGGVTLSVSLASGKQYFVKVSSPAGSLFTYDLAIGKSGGGGGGGKHLVLMGVESPDEEPLGDAYYLNPADDPDNAAHVLHHPVSTSSIPGSPVSSSSHTQISDAPLATGTSVAVALPGTASAVQSGSGTVRILPGVLLNLGPQAPPVLLAATTVPATVSVEPNRDVSSALMPGLRPSVLHVASGSDAALSSEEEPDEVPAVRPAPAADPADTPFDPPAGAQVGGRLGQQACDACFADGSWRADPVELGMPMPEVPAAGVTAEDSGPALDGASAAMALAVVLGGYGSAHRGESEPRTRRRFRM